MNRNDVLELVKARSKSKKAIRSAPTRGSKSFGVGLTELRKLAREIGRDHALARELWERDIHELRILGLLVDDPKLITREQVEKQVEELDEPVLGHVFSSCDASLSRVPFVVDLATDWIDSRDKTRRSCGYGLLSEIAASKKKTAPDDAFFLDYIERIGRTYEDEGLVEGAYALLCMGKRNKKLNAAALKVARKIGPVEYEGDNKCEPFDVAGHLTKDHLKRRLGIA